MPIPNGSYQPQVPMLLLSGPHLAGKDIWTGGFGHLSSHSISQLRRFPSGNLQLWAQFGCCVIPFPPLQQMWIPNSRWRIRGLRCHVDQSATEAPCRPAPERVETLLGHGRCQSGEFGPTGGFRFGSFPDHGIRTLLESIRHKRAESFWIGPGMGLNLTIRGSRSRALSLIRRP